MHFCFQTLPFPHFHYHNAVDGQSWSYHQAHSYCLAKAPAPATEQLQHFLHLFKPCTQNDADKLGGQAAFCTSGLILRSEVTRGCDRSCCAAWPRAGTCLCPLGIHRGSSRMTVPAGFVPSFCSSEHKIIICRSWGCSSLPYPVTSYQRDAIRTCQ